MFLAIPPGYATVFWPASGIALAFVYRFGNHTLPGVLLGSLVLNFFTYLSQSNPQDISVLAVNATCIACGAMLQAWVGNTLLKRYLDVHTKLETLNSNVKYIFFGGLLSGLVSCTIGVATLLTTETIPLSNAAFSWFTWYVGDVLGIIVFAPSLTLGLDRSIKTARKLSVVLPLVTVFLLSIGLFVVVKNWNNTHAHTQFKHEARLANLELQEELNASLMQIDTLHDLYSASTDVSKAEFELFAKNILRRNPAIFGLAWVPKVAQEQKENFEKKIRESGIPNYRIISFKNSKTNTPYLFPATYIVTLRQRNIIYGLNLASEENRFEAIKKSVRTNQPVATDKIRLAADGPKDPYSFVVFHPIYKNGTNHLTVQERHRDLNGFITASFRYKTIVDSVMSRWMDKHVIVSLYDKSMRNDPLLYTTAPYETNRPFRGISLDRFKIVYDFNLLDRQIQIEFKLPYDLSSQNIDWTIWLTLSASLIFVSLVSIFLLYLTGQTALIEKIVETRTSQLRLQKRNLERAMQSAESANRAKSHFLANMSHEIRTPMTGIIGMARLLKKSPLPPVERNHIETISYSAEALLQIIDDILDFSKIEAGKLSIENIAFNYRDLCNEVVNLCTLQALEKRLEFQLIYHKECPEAFYGDPLRIRQVLFNLCSNAIKFTGKGSVTVEVSLEKQEADRATVTTAVTDTGIGIPQQKQNIIFEKFHQADMTTTRKYGGSGLGLTISREILHIMDSDIKLESEEGKGSKFSFRLTLPLAHNIKNSSNDNEALYNDYSGKTALLAEDNIVNQQVIETFLENYGIEVTTVSNGAEALQKLDTIRYDIVFMDCQMPIMDGYTATKHIRQHANLDKMPVVAITARALSSDRELCLAAGMNDYISKPIDELQLAAVLEKWLLGSEPIPIQSPVETPIETGPFFVNPLILDKLRSSMGDKFDEILTTYIRVADKSISNMEIALSERDLKRIENIAHSLKSSSGQIGAQTLQKIVQDLEKAANVQDFEQSSNLLLSAHQELTGVKSFLQRLIN